MNVSHLVSAAALAAAALLAVGITARQDHAHHGASGAAPPAGEARLAPPPAMNAEHAHLHEQLAAALAAGGRTAEAAKAVEAVLSKHFVEEEAYALPPLGLLALLGERKLPPPEQARAAIAMADKLRANYATMLDEHRQLTGSLKALEAAATAEDKPAAADFARALTHHAQHEEQVLYPAALLVGEYLKLRHADVGQDPPAPGHGH